MKHFVDLELNERNEIVILMSNWLKPYTDKIIKNITSRIDEIISSDSTMNLLKELKLREDLERKDFSNTVGKLLYEFEIFKEYDSHNNPITHAGSYRDVLYDLYIKGI